MVDDRPVDRGPADDALAADAAEGLGAGPTSAAQSLVYYVRKDGLIKIGFTADMRLRMQSLMPMAILAVEPGGRSLETTRHRQFVGDLARPREWFHASPQIYAHIARCASLHPVPDFDALVDDPSTLSGVCPEGHTIAGPNYQGSNGGGHTCKTCIQTRRASGVAAREGLPFDFATEAASRYAKLMGDAE